MHLLLVHSWGLKKKKYQKKLDVGELKSENWDVGVKGFGEVGSTYL